MFPTPYSTTVCKDYVLDRIVTEIQKTSVLEGASLRLLEDNPMGGKTPNETLIYMLGPDVTHVPTFAHPVFIKESDEREYVVIDVRNFTRLSREGQLVTSAHLDMALAKVRAILSAYWYKNDPIDFLSLGNIQITIFARWMTDILTRRLALTPETQMRVTVISAYYYLCMFSKDVEIDEKTRIKWAGKISESTRVSSDVVLEIIERLQMLLNVHDFVAALTSTSDSARFESFNVGLLFTVAGGSWFGANAAEIVACALEHPPTFIALLERAMKERGYRRTTLGRTVEMSTKRGEDKAFLYNLQRLPV